MNNESDKIQSESSGKYFNRILTNANSWYTKTKSRFPMIEYSIDKISPIISPFSSKLTQYSTPLIEKLDSAVDLVVQQGQKTLEKNTLPEGWLKKARQMAESTSVLILAGADDLYLWSSTVFEKYHIEQIYRVPINVSTRALTSMWQIQREMGLRVVEFLDNRRDYIAHTKLYGKLDHALGINEKLETVIDYYDEIKEIKKEDIMEKQWPNNVRSMFDKMLSSVGGESIVVYLDDKVWNRLDCDQDGVVTVKDLVDFGNPKTLLEWSKQAFASIKIPHQVNGGEIKAEA